MDDDGDGDGTIGTNASMLVNSGDNDARDECIVCQGKSVTVNGVPCHEAGVKRRPGERLLVPFVVVLVVVVTVAGLDVVVVEAIVVVMVIMKVGEYWKQHL